MMPLLNSWRSSLLFPGTLVVFAAVMVAGRPAAAAEDDITYHQDIDVRAEEATNRLLGSVDDRLSLDVE